MQKIQSIEDLRVAIIQLEREHEEEGKQLKQQLLLTMESVKPLNLLKNTFREAAASKELKENILTTVVGLIVGFVSNLLIEKVTNTQVKKIITNTLMTGIAVLVEKNSDTLKSFGNEFMKVFKKKSGEVKDDQDVVESV